MKKLVATLIATGMLLGFGAAFAQTLEASDTHELEITIPPVILLRFVDSAGDLIAAPDPVEFDILAAGFDPLGTYTPEPGANWADIQVFFNDGDFTVEVSTNNATFDWSKVTVTPAGGLITAAFDLPVGGAREILGQTTSSGNWENLGISPASYGLTLTGEEASGTYLTTVTYTVYEF